MCRRISWPYVEGPSGWGEPTTKQTQFCEMHYYMTPHIAEFINTLSNLAYIYLGYYGISTMRQSSLKHDDSIRWSFISLAIVGVGSSAFHTSVTYTGQLADEIAMLYATATIGYAAFGIDYDMSGRVLLRVLLTLIVVVITTVHIYRGESTVFQVSWVAMVVSIFMQCRQLLKLKIPDDGQVRVDLQRLAFRGTVSFLTGFLLWNIDNIMCSSLLGLRSVIGMPWGFMTELHGWWHVLTGLGVYYYIVFIQYLRAYLTTRWRNSSLIDQIRPSDAKLELVWSHYSILPYLNFSKVRKQQDSKSS